MNRQLFVRVAIRDFGSGAGIYTESGGPKVILIGGRNGRLQVRDGQTGTLHDAPEDHPVLTRIADCLNAFEGIEDPSSFKDSIAATPELMDALSIIVKHVGWREDPVSQYVAGIAKAAIEKATGERP